MQGKIIIFYYRQYINKYDCEDQFTVYHFFYCFQVMKTCKRLGIKTVAIYSEADANAVCFDKFLRILICWSDSHCACQNVK